MGRNEFAFAQNRKLRIISLAPSTSEILFSLGLSDEIIATSTFCNFPPESKTKEKIGTFSQPDIEKILSLKPDIIFATGLEQAAVVAHLRQLNLNVLISDPATIEELFTSIEEIGGLTNKKNEAVVLVNQMREKIAEINAKVATISEQKKPKVFVELWSDPLMAAGKGSFVDELITLAGGINIAYDTPRPYSYFSVEQVIARNPDCIILGYMNEGEYSHLKHRLGWDVISAVKNGRIYSDIDPDLFLRPGPRLIIGLEEIYKRLYPE